MKTKRIYILLIEIYGSHSTSVCGYEHPDRSIYDSRMPVWYTDKDDIQKELGHLFRVEEKYVRYGRFYFISAELILNDEIPPEVLSEFLFLKEGRFYGAIVAFLIKGRRNSFYITCGKV